MKKHRFLKTPRDEGCAQCSFVRDADVHRIWLQDLVDDPGLLEELRAQSREARRKRIGSYSPVLDLVDATLDELGGALAVSAGIRRG